MKKLVRTLLKFTQKIMDILLNYMLLILILNVLKDQKVARSKLLDDLLEKSESIDIENYDLIDLNINK